MSADNKDSDLDATTSANSVPVLTPSAAKAIEEAWHEDEKKKGGEVHEEGKVANA